MPIYIYIISIPHTYNLNKEIINYIKIKQITKLNLFERDFWVLFYVIFDSFRLKYSYLFNKLYLLKENLGQKIT